MEGRRDLKERSFEFARRIVALCVELNKNPGVGCSLSEHVLRAGTAVGVNIEEAYSGVNRDDYPAMIHLASQDARETHYWLRLIAASAIIPAERLHPLTVECNELIAILTAILRKTKENANKVKGEECAVNSPE